MKHTIGDTQQRMQEILAAIDTNTYVGLFVVTVSEVNEPDNPESMVIVEVSTPGGQAYDLQLVPKT